IPTSSHYASHFPSFNRGEERHCRDADAFLAGQLSLARPGYRIWIFLSATPAPTPNPSPQGGGEQVVVLDRPLHQRRAHHHSPPPCGEGLGVGVRRSRKEWTMPPRRAIKIDSCQDEGWAGPD